MYFVVILTESLHLVKYGERTKKKKECLDVYREGKSLMSMALILFLISTKNILMFI